MKVERVINIQKGPEISNTIGSTVVKAKGDGGYWISTVHLPGQPSHPKDTYETLIFAVPTKIDVIKNEKGEREFNGKTRSDQTYKLPVALYNETNMSKKEAKTNHKGAVRAAKATLRTPRK